MPRWTIILAPLFIVFVLVAYNYIPFGRQIIERDWSWSDSRDIIATSVQAIYDATAITVNSFRTTMDSAPLPEASSLPAIHLRVEQGSLAAMTADLPASAKAHYYNARLLYPDGIWRKVKYRLRGRGPWHWGRDKPSLRIKLKKSALIGGQRHLNLVNPEDRTMVANLIDERLAREMGLLTHQTMFTRLFINGRYMGVYHRTSHEDQNLLRLRNRVPGPIYEANGLRRRWRAEDFQVRAVDQLLPDTAPLKQMVDALYMANDPARYATLWEVLSFDKYARYLAFMNLVSATHGDFFHNHLFYFDPAARLIEPWVSDSNGHGMLLLPKGLKRIFTSRSVDAEVPLNELMTPLLDVVLRDPRFRHQRNVYLYRALNGFGSVSIRHRQLDDIYQRIDPDVRADRYKGAMEAGPLEPYRLIFSNAQYEAEKRLLYDWIERRNDFLRRELENVVVRVWIEPSQGAASAVFTIEITGQVAVNFDIGSNQKLLADHDLDGTPENEVSGPLLLHPGLRLDEGKVRRALQFFHRFPEHRLMAGAERYLLSGSGISADTLASAFTNAVTGTPVIPQISVGPAPSPDAVSVSIHPWLFPEE